MPKPVVAIVGRPNVGKSALLNRFLQRRDAIVEDTPGVTRDRLYRDCEWAGRSFTLIDTGGILLNDPDTMRSAIRMQVEVAIHEADLILLVVDVQEGLNPLDTDVAAMLRNAGKKVILASNKADNENIAFNTGDFYTLGMGEPYPVSAIHGMGSGDLLDRIIELLPRPENEDEEKTQDINICIIGRPNVGKSSLLNALTGEERSIVTNIPGTTRDAVDSHFEWKQIPFTIIDTAGIRHKSKIDSGIEYYSVDRAKRAMKRSHVGLLVLDATDPAAMQDKRIGGILNEWGKAMIIVVNKWDLMVEQGKSQSLHSPESGRFWNEMDNLKKEYIKNIHKEMEFLSWAPVVFVSALHGHGIDKILPSVVNAYRQFNRKVETPALNHIFRDAFYNRHPPSYKGNSLKLFYTYQDATQPPTFIFKVNDPTLLHFSYRRYLENHVRKVLGLEGTPIRMIFKGDKEKKPS